METAESVVHLAIIVVARIVEQLDRLLRCCAAEDALQHHRVRGFLAVQNCTHDALRRQHEQTTQRV